MKRFLVTIEYANINRKNNLVIWAGNKEEAIKRALRDWGNPATYKSITAEETTY